MQEVAGQQSELCAQGGWAICAPQNPNAGWPSYEGGRRHRVAEAADDSAHVSIETNAIKEFPPCDHVAEALMSRQPKREGVLPIVHMDIKQTGYPAHDAVVTHV